jgi:hypothetical protein
MIADDDDDDDDDDVMSDESLSRFLQLNRAASAKTSI